MAEEQENKLNPEEHEDFDEIIARKQAVLLSLGPLLPIPAITTLAMAMTEILLTCSNEKAPALEVAEMVKNQLVNNIEYADANGIGYWNTKSIQ
jgi:hypothetical protein